MEFVVLCLIAILGIGSGLFIIGSVLRKNIDLPEANIHGFFAIGPARKGQEWVVFLIGIVWTLFWGTLFLAFIFEW